MGETIALLSAQFYVQVDPWGACTGPWADYNEHVLTSMRTKPSLTTTTTARMTVYNSSHDAPVRLPGDLGLLPSTPGSLGQRHMHDVHRLRIQLQEDDGKPEMESLVGGLGPRPGCTRYLDSRRWT